MRDRAPVGQRDRREVRHHPAGHLLAPQGAPGRRPGRRAPGTASGACMPCGPEGLKPRCGTCTRQNSGPSTCSSSSTSWNPVISLRSPGRWRLMRSLPPCTSTPRPSGCMSTSPGRRAIVSWMGEYALLEAEPGGRFCSRYPRERRSGAASWSLTRRVGCSSAEASADCEPHAARRQHQWKSGSLPDRGRHPRRTPAPRPATRQEARACLGGWTHYLARLGIAASGRDPGRDSGMPESFPGSRLTVTQAGRSGGSQCGLAAACRWQQRQKSLFCAPRPPRTGHLPAVPLGDHAACPLGKLLARFRHYPRPCR